MKDFVIGHAAFAKISAVEGIKMEDQNGNGSIPVIDKSTKEKLQSYIDRVERLEEEKAHLSSDIRDLLCLAKGDGFDTKAIKQVIRLRKKEKDERDEELNTLEAYMLALEMI